MNIEELRERKRELLARKRYEQDLVDAGCGDNLALFMVNEELLDVNARLRALAPKSPKVGQHRSISAGWAADKQQYLNWKQSNDDDDDAGDSGSGSDRKKELFHHLQTGMDSISDRQRQILLMWASGMSITEIAEELGVNCSTASRTLTRAKKNVQKISLQQERFSKIQDAGTLDASDPRVAKELMSALTPHQAVCFYLYYSEHLSMREIQRLLGVEQSSISRTITRAVNRISDAIGNQATILENVAGLDDVVYSVYCGLCETEDLPSEVESRIRREPSKGYIWRKNHGAAPVREDTVYIKPRTRKSRGKLLPEEHGKLYRLLTERYQDQSDTRSLQNPIARWLMKVFRTLTKRR